MFAQSVCAAVGGRSGASASANCSEAALKPASLLSQILDAHSATLNARSTHAQRTLNATPNMLKSAKLQACSRVKKFLFEEKSV